MKNSDLELILVIVKILAEYGPEFLLKTMKAWEVTNPSIEDIEKLKEGLKSPEEYFKE